MKYNQPKHPKITLLYTLAVFAVVLFTWLFHEFGHWITYRIFGFEAYMSFNKAGIIGNDVPNEMQQVWATAAGPIVTLSQALVAYFILIRKGWNPYIYLLVFIPFYMRLLAGAMNFINPNDEGALSQHFGLGLYTLSIVVSLFLFTLVFKASRKYQLVTKFHILTTLLVMFFSSIVIMTDQIFKIQLL